MKMTGGARGVTWRVLGVMEVFLLGTGTDPPEREPDPLG